MKRWVKMEKVVRDLNYSREGLPTVSKHVANVYRNVLIVGKNTGYDGRHSQWRGRGR